MFGNLQIVEFFSRRSNLQYSNWILWYSNQILQYCHQIMQYSNYIFAAFVSQTLPQTVDQWSQILLQLLCNWALMATCTQAEFMRDSRGSYTRLTMDNARTVIQYSPQICADWMWQVGRGGTADCSVKVATSHPLSQTWKLDNPIVDVYQLFDHRD